MKPLTIPILKGEREKERERESNGKRLNIVIYKEGTILSRIDPPDSLPANLNSEEEGGKFRRNKKDPKKTVSQKKKKNRGEEGKD